MPRTSKKIYDIGHVQIRKREGKSKNWYARYTIPGGKRIEQSLGVTNVTRALEKAREIDDALQRGDFAELQERQIKRHITMREFIKEFKRSYTGWSQATMKRNEYFLANIAHEFGDLPLYSVGPGMIQRWLGTLRNEGSQQAEPDKRKPLSKASVNRHRSYLSTLFKVAVEWGLVPRNPVANTSYLKEDQKVPEAMTAEEIEKLMAELKPHAQFAVQIFLDTGMRQSELFDLTWNDVDFEKHQLTIRKSKQGEFRVIPMSERVENLLRVEKEKEQSPYVVTGPEGKPLKDIKKSLRRAAERAGIPHVHHHKLRHTFATTMRELGVPLDRIQELLGHRTMTMTMRYAQATPTQLRGAIDVLNDFRKKQDAAEHDEC